uniref:Uncharacterized protein n=1 Tax=Manihot esculenta TaxID=3983 RepID=A0A2C9UHZ4_MANES
MEEGIVEEEAIGKSRKESRKKKKYRALIPKRTQGIKEISMNILL